jgi:hypothetical protein
LPEFGCYGGIVCQDEKDSRPLICNPSCRGERRGSRFEEQLLQVVQAAGVAGERLKVAGAGDHIADLLDRHRGVSGEGR